MSQVHWDRLFEDLEGQLASEWESERAALDTESERLRISRLELRDRLRALRASEAATVLDVAGCGRIRGRLRTLGADWAAVALLESEAPSRERATRIVPLHAIRGLGVDHGRLLASLDGGAPDHGSLEERMTLGFVVRDLARRRTPARILRIGESDLHGTIDRAGVDHLDLAIHDAGTPRTAGAVRGFCIVPFAALTGVQIDGVQTP